MIDILLFDDQLGREAALARSAFAACDGVQVLSLDDAGVAGEHDGASEARVRIWTHSGQSVRPDQTIVNDLQTITQVFQQKPAGVTSWALLLIDMRFDSGELTEGGLLPVGRPGDESFGNQIVDCIRGLEPDAPVVLFSTYGQAEMSAGSVPYLAKLGLDTQRLHDALLRHGRCGRTERRSLLGLEDEVVESPAAFAAFTDALGLARLDLPVLITGDTGTGKELLARFLHRRSDRASGPFVGVNMAAVPAELFEASFLGHERGAFTGASDARQGFFEQANGGTLFLDEIGELHQDMQAKLLRVLQDGKVRPIGARSDRQVNVRLVSATNRGDRHAISGVREDLFQRISGAVIHLSPLRERMDDVLPLAEAFLTKAQADFGRQRLSFSTAASEALCSAAFPGNVRELRNRVRAAVARSGNHALIEPRSLGLEAAELQKECRPLGTVGSVDASVSLAASTHARSGEAWLGVGLDELIVVLSQTEIETEPSSLRGAVARLDTCVSAIRRRLAAAALAATRHPVSGKASVQAAMQLLTDDRSLRAAAPHRLLNDMLGRSQRERLDSETIEQLVAEAGNVRRSNDGSSR